MCVLVCQLPFVFVFFFLARRGKKAFVMEIMDDFYSHRIFQSRIPVICSTFSLIFSSFSIKSLNFMSFIWCGGVCAVDKFLYFFSRCYELSCWLLNVLWSLFALYYFSFFFHKYIAFCCRHKTLFFNVSKLKRIFWFDVCMRIFVFFLRNI